MNDDDTPDSLDLEEGDSIEVALERESLLMLSYSVNVGAGS